MDLVLAVGQWSGYKVRFSWSDLMTNQPYYGISLAHCHTFASKLRVLVPKYTRFVISFIRHAHHNLNRNSILKWEAGKTHGLQILCVGFVCCKTHTPHKRQRRIGSAWWTLRQLSPVATLTQRVEDPKEEARQALRYKRDRVIRAKVMIQGR